MSSKPPPAQWITVLVAALLWAVWPIFTLTAFAAVYVIALGVVNLALVWRPAWVRWDALTPGGRRVIFLLLALVPVSTAIRLSGFSAPLNEWRVLKENFSDRLRLERTPSIAPAFVVTYEPQRFIIYAPGARDVSVQWTPKSAPNATVNLGHGVFWLDFDPQSEQAMAGLKSDELACVVTTDGTSHLRSLRLIRPLAHPRRLHSSPNRGLAAAVSEETDELILLRRDGQFRRIPVGDGPTDCALFDAAGRVVVAHRFTGELWIIDVETANVLRRIPGEPFQTRLAISPQGGRIAVALSGVQPGVKVMSLPDFGESVFTPLDFPPDQLEFGRDGSEFVVTDVRNRRVLRLTEPTPDEGASDAWLHTDPPLVFPRPITALGRTPDGKQLVAATTVSLLGPEPVVANHFIENTVHFLDLEQWKVAQSTITDRRGLGQDSPGDTEHGISPLGFAVFGNRLLAAFTGSNEVAQISAAGISPGYYSMDPYPLFGPESMADLGDGWWCVASPAEGNLGIFNAAGELQTLIALSENDEEAVEENTLAQRRRHGERSFYEGTRAGIACQSCHWNADTDFCRHDIGQGMPVDVLTVRGIAGTSPYLRDGSHRRLQELHDVARLGYRDYPRPVPWDRAEAVTAYMENLPPPLNPHLLEPPDAARLRRGVDAFVTADCARCHTPPAMTNLGQHPARVLFPDFQDGKGEFSLQESQLDTPSLRGVSQTPPYLHDGRAAGLRAVLIDWNKAGRHGNVKRLHSDQIDDLLYLLERL